MFTLFFILFAGLLIKSFYTHYISEKRKYFSFDDRRFTDEDYLKVQDLNIGRLERVFLFIMLGLYVAALLVHIFINPVLSVWLLGAFLAVMLLLSLIIDLRLYTISYDKSHIIMAVIWLAAFTGIFVFLYMSGGDDVELSFEDASFTTDNEDFMLPYEDITEIGMTETLPDIPFNHRVLGVFSQLHGSFEAPDRLVALHVEDDGEPALHVVVNNYHLYINDEDPEVTESWFNELQSRTGN